MSDDNLDDTIHLRVNKELRRQLERLKKPLKRRTVSDVARYILEDYVAKYFGDDPPCPPKSERAAHGAGERGSRKTNHTSHR